MFDMCLTSFASCNKLTEKPAFVNFLENFAKIFAIIFSSFVLFSQQLSRKCENKNSHFILSFDRKSAETASLLVHCEQRQDVSVKNTYREKQVQ